MPLGRGRIAGAVRRRPRVMYRRPGIGIWGYLIVALLVASVFSYFFLPLISAILVIVGMIILVIGIRFIRIIPIIIGPVLIVIGILLKNFI